MPITGPIPIGAEVTLMGVKDHPIGAITYNTTDKICVLTKTGEVISGSRVALHPLMTGKKYPVKDWLEILKD